MLQNLKPWLVKTVVELASICKPFLINLVQAGYSLATHKSIYFMCIFMGLLYNPFLKPF